MEIRTAPPTEISPAIRVPFGEIWASSTKGSAANADVGKLVRVLGAAGAEGSAAMPEPASNNADNSIAQRTMTNPDSTKTRNLCRVLPIGNTKEKAPPEPKSKRGHFTLPKQEELHTV